MAKGKQRAWHVLDGLYRDVEDARRHRDHGTNPDGAAAYERWLEIIDIATWYLEEGDQGDSTELDGSSGDEAGTPSDADGPDESGPQLVLPGTGELDVPVPRATQADESRPVPLVGAVAGLTTAELEAELKRRGLTPSGKVRLGCGTREAT